MNFDALKTRVHAQAKAMGWWDKPRSLDTLLMLVVSELAEAMEGDRKNLMDDHLPHRTMLEVEIADAIIRICDIAGGFNLHIPDRIESVKHHDTVADALWTTVCLLVAWSKDFKYPFAIKRVLTQLMVICDMRDFDIKTVINEKLEYNLKRADHQPENRSAENGKRY